MGKIFNYDAPFWRGMNKVADVIILNVLTILFSIPLVTIGAAVTALYDAMWKLQRDDGTVWNNFWSAFKSNFKQSTVIWIIVAVISAIVGYAAIFYLGVGLQKKPLFLVLAAMPFLIWVGLVSWVFPLQSRFYNTIPMTIKNALVCALAFLPRTLGMIALNILPMVIFLLRLDIFMRLFVFLILGYFAVAAYLNCRLLKKPFETMIAKCQKNEETELEAET